MNRLKPEQRRKLTTEVAARVGKAWQEEWNQLRKHEVNDRDAAAIMVAAWNEIGGIEFKELEAKAPEKPRPTDK